MNFHFIHFFHLPRLKIHDMLLLSLDEKSKGGDLVAGDRTDRVKRMVTDDIAKEVIAFANAEGGTIYIGVADDGTPVGLADFDAEYTRLTNIIRDAILPDVTVFVHYTKMKGNQIRVDVNEGSSKPYYLKKHGLKPSGVYVRQGGIRRTSFQRKDPPDDQKFRQGYLRGPAQSGAGSDLHGGRGDLCPLSCRV